MQRKFFGSTRSMLDQLTPNELKSLSRWMAIFTFLNEMGLVESQTANSQDQSEGVSVVMIDALLLALGLIFYIIAEKIADCYRPRPTFEETIARLASITPPRDIELRQVANDNNEVTIQVHSLSSPETNEAPAVDKNSYKRLTNN